MPAAITLDQVPQLPVVDLPGAVLCSVGRWNDRDYSTADFDEAVANARELAGVYHIPLKLGHSDAQMLGQSDGDPALGWVENVRRDGQNLVGDFRNVPLRLAQLLKSGAYRGRSAEFLLNTKYGGKLRRFMLRAVALLGVDAPAVESLPDITALYNARKQAEVYAALSHAAEAIVTAGAVPSATAASAPGSGQPPHNSRRGMAQKEAAMPHQNPLRRLARRLHLAAGDGMDTGATGAVGDMGGASLDAIQSAVESALAAAYPPAMPEDSEEPGADGPSQNVLDWFLHDSPPYVIVSDQDVDNLYKITFAYDPQSDTATLDSPVPVKGTYTEAQPGAETGEPAVEPGAADQPAPDAAMMARAELAALVTLAKSEPDDAVLGALAAACERVDLAGDGGAQRAVAKIVAALDKALTDLGDTASGRPGMSFIRTTLAEVKRKLSGMKFPTATVQAAPPARLSKGADVDIATLARKLGLPATATEAQVGARLDQLGGTAPAETAAYPAIVATLSKRIDTWETRESARQLGAAMDRATQEGRLTPPLREEVEKLSKQAGVEAAVALLDKLPAVVDLAERGRSGEPPAGFAGQLSPTAIALLKRQHGEGVVARLSDTRTLAQKRDDLLASKQHQRGERTGITVPAAQGGK